MPPKRQDKANKEKTQGDFEPVTYTSTQLRTATTLLTVDDEGVIIKVDKKINLKRKKNKFPFIVVRQTQQVRVGVL